MTSFPVIHRRKWKFISYLIGKKSVYGFKWPIVYLCVLQLFYDLSTFILNILPHIGFELNPSVGFRVSKYSIIERLLLWQFYKKALVIFSVEFTLFNSQLTI